jgi:hypothetical protein
MMHKPNFFLIIAGHLTVCAALLHVGCLFFLPESIDFFNGPRWLYDLSWGELVAVCLGIMAFLGAMSLYAYSGAGWIKPLPGLRVGLTATGFLFLGRGLLLFPQLLPWGEISQAANGKHFRLMAFSTVSLLMGIFYLAGTQQNLSTKRVPKESSLASTPLYPSQVKDSGSSPPPKVSGIHGTP